MCAISTGEAQCLYGAIMMFIFFSVLGSNVLLTACELLLPEE